MVQMHSRSVMPYYYYYYIALLLQVLIFPRKGNPNVPGIIKFNFFLLEYDFTDLAVALREDTAVLELKLRSRQPPD